MKTNKGQLLKEKRKEKGLSVPKLAVMLAIPKDRIYKWEKGTEPSTLEDHQKIDAFLNENVENFTGFHEPRADYKTKYIELLEKTIQEKEKRIQELENSSGKDERKKASA